VEAYSFALEESNAYNGYTVICPSTEWEGEEFTVEDVA
jgi:hypothetical protein